VKTRVIYDETCPFCVRWVRRLQRLDWLHRLEFVQGGAGLEAVRCITPRGRVHRGARAFRALGLRVPLLAPLALLLWVPGFTHIAEVAYRWISEHRRV